MFTLAMEARRRDMGVVGSTSNILDFIAGKVRRASPFRSSSRGPCASGGASAHLLAVAPH